MLHGPIRIPATIEQTWKDRMSLFPAFLATRFPLKDFSLLAHFDPIGYPYPVLLLQCNEKRLRYFLFFFFFPPLSFLRRSSPSSQFSRRIIASSIRLYTRFHTKSLTSLIFSEKNKNIYIYSANETIRKERKKGNKFFSKFYRTKHYFSSYIHFHKNE